MATKKNTTQKSKLYQQGDVLMFSGHSIPEGAEPIKPKNGYFVLAEGETTGHFHGVPAIEGVTSFWKSGNDMFLTVEATVKVGHQEHGVIDLPKGTFKIGIVREVDPFAEEIRHVQD